MTAGRGVGTADNVPGDGEGDGEGCFWWGVLILYPLVMNNEAEQEKSARKVSDYVSLETGFVVSRAKAEEMTEHSYRVLTQKGFAEAEKLYALDFDTVFFQTPVPDKFLTRVGDVIVRLGPPYGARVITAASRGLLVPSAFMIVRVQDETVLSPRYLAYFINRETSAGLSDLPAGVVLKPLTKESFAKFEVKLPLAAQEEVARIYNFSRKEQRLLAQIADWKLKLSQAKIAEIEKKAGADA